MIAPDANILVINVARIGDTLLTTAVLRAIKAACPAGKLGCLAHPKRVAVLEGLPWVNHLGVVTPTRAHWRGRFSPKAWDVAIVYGHDSALIRYAARVAHKVVAFAQDDPALNRLLWRAVPVPEHREQIHLVHEYLLLPAAAGIETNDYRLAYYPFDAELAAARAWLEKNAPRATRFIGYQLASFPAKSYRDWPLENFAALGRQILDRYPGSVLVIFGGKESRDKAGWLRDRLGDRVVAAAGLMSLRESAALMKHLDLYIGVDTGPTHLTGALAVPMIALYHCFHRGRRLAPLMHRKLRIIEHPCPDERCTRDSSMEEITVDMVWKCVKDLLPEYTKDRKTL
jgi:heptosyltransferase-3